ncbi:DUF1993 domain-containing protein [Sphingobium boeckii]|uniref:DUF1993 domain-containing protein n=1 Tax=Sphingobium boeckii TaxID=1082345 RepID=A0A7W9EEX4_9SPHN|nr:DUF1993 domain-containing protein [Sphingobium boeckii]MBB5685490.1 hypothetical protein [Sphingobium boeckii]
MSTSLYDLTIPVFIRGLNALSQILEKGRTYAQEQGIDSTDLLATRLTADMAPITAQIQRASDTAKGTAVRIGKIENVVFEDNEASFDDLQARIGKTIAFLEAVPRSAMEGREADEVILTTPNREIAFTGQSYALSFAIPNFFFHMTTAYALLRHRGVPIGKLDYLGSA